MARVRFSSSGVAFYGGGTPELAAAMRELLLQRGEATDEVVDPLTLENLSKVYFDLNREYGTNLVAELDFEELHFAVGLVVGKCSQLTRQVEARKLIPKVQAFINAVEEIVESAKLLEAGLQDLRDSAAIEHIVSASMKFYGSSGSTVAQDRIAVAARQLEPLLAPAGSVRVALDELRPKGGRPPIHYLDPFCGACEAALRRAGRQVT